MDPHALDQLLARARRHDPDALEALVEAYSPRVFGLLYRMARSRSAAEDLMQETFLRMVRGIGAYEHSGRFEAWLFRIAANLARDYIRRRRRRGASASLEQRAVDGEDYSVDVEDRDQAPPPMRLAETEDVEHLNACLAKLPELDREIILLRHFADLSFREIAETLNVPLGTALARAHRALARLRSEYLGDEERPRMRVSK